MAGPFFPTKCLTEKTPIGVNYSRGLKSRQKSRRLSSAEVKTIAAASSFKATCSRATERADRLPEGIWPNRRSFAIYRDRPGSKDLACGAFAKFVDSGMRSSLTAHGSKRRIFSPLMCLEELRGEWTLKP